MLSLLPLLSMLAVGDSLPRPAAFATRSAAEASFIVHRQPAIPLVSLRLAILADDPPGYAGAGHLVQHLLLPSLREQADRVGGQIQMERSADAVVYTVTGPTAELRYLAQLLKSTLRPTRPSEGALLGANRALAEERLAEWETADQHVRAALRARLFPGDISAAGTESSARRLSAESLPAVWAHLYRPNRVSVIAVGDVTLAEVQEAFGELPEAPAARAVAEARDTVSLAALAPAEATRGWLAIGYLASDLDPAALSVSARLLRDVLRQRLPDAEVTGEHWWTHHGQALVLVVAAPERTLATARRALNTAASSLQGELTARRVREAAKSLRREMLFYARTPERMAGVLGRFADRGGDPDAAQRFYAELEEVDAAQVGSVLKHLLAHSPSRVEIPPQRLNQR